MNNICMYSTDQMQGIRYVNYTRLHEEANTLIHWANTCLYKETNAFREGKHVCLIPCIWSVLYIHVAHSHVQTCKIRILSYAKVFEQFVAISWNILHLYEIRALWEVQKISPKVAIPTVIHHHKNFLICIYVRTCCHVHFGVLGELTPSKLLLPQSQLHLFPPTILEWDLNILHTKFTFLYVHMYMYVCL